MAQLCCILTWTLVEAKGQVIMACWVQAQLSYLVPASQLPAPQFNPVAESQIKEALWILKW